MAKDKKQIHHKSNYRYQRRMQTEFFYLWTEILNYRYRTLKIENILDSEGGYSYYLSFNEEHHGGTDADRIHLVVGQRITIHVSK